MTHIFTSTLATSGNLLIILFNPNPTCYLLLCFVFIVSGKGMARRVAITSDVTIDNLCISSEIGLCCSLSPLQFQNRELTCGLTYILITLIDGHFIKTYILFSLRLSIVACTKLYNNIMGLLRGGVKKVVVLGGAHHKVAYHPHLSLLGAKRPLQIKLSVHPFVHVDPFRVSSIRLFYLSIYLSTYIYIYI